MFHSKSPKNRNVNMIRPLFLPTHESNALVETMQYNWASIFSLMVLSKKRDKKQFPRLNNCLVIRHFSDANYDHRSNATAFVALWTQPNQLESPCFNILKQTVKTYIDNKHQEKRTLNFQLSIASQKRMCRSSVSSFNVERDHFVEYENRTTWNKIHYLCIPCLRNNK